MAKRKRAAPEPQAPGLRRGREAVHARDADAAWTPVDVRLERDGEAVLEATHYDTGGGGGGGGGGAAGAAAADLEGAPHEGMGFFVGLEVIRPDRYRVTTNPDGTKRFTVLSAGGEGATGDAPPAPRQLQEKRQKKEKPKDSTADEPRPAGAARGDERQPKKTKKDKKSATALPNAKIAAESNATEAAADEAHFTDAEVASLQQSWLVATGGVTLHPRLCRGLLRRGFPSPLPVQAATLPAAVLGRRNLVGAAPTGSGKTLAFLLPVLQHLLDEQDRLSASAGGSDEISKSLQALILAPTRELAMQIHRECDQLIPRQAGTIVGGLAVAKQARVLNKFRPPILVGTPGRLWELISSRDYEHLRDLSQIRFLIIDEADRMMKQGSFPQLNSILEAIRRANPMEDDNEEEDLVDEDYHTNDGRLLGLPGIRGEARVEMLTSNILEQIEQQRSGKVPTVKEVDDDELQSQESDNDQDDSDGDEISLPVKPPVHRLTFVFSATLTLPASDKYVKSKTKSKVPPGIDGAIAEILEKAHAKGKIKIVDLSSGNKIGAAKRAVTAPEKQTQKDSLGIQLQNGVPSQHNQFQLPPGLVLQQIKCTQKHKDSHLYAYLMTTKEGSSGPALVFCNSIAGVRRVGSTLQTLGLEVRILHAKMQQRARLKAVESLKKSKGRVVVVTTDVASRGLDIPTVSSVVHYDASRTVDTFVHRAGRTARGIGEGSSGFSLSLIASGEDKEHARIVQALQAKFTPVHLDSRLLAAAQQRVNLASKVIAEEEAEHRRQQTNQWYHDQAAAVGIDVDEDVLDSADGDGRRQQRSKEAKAAKTNLRALLSQPMVAQRYGKFLSTVGSVTSLRVDPVPSAKK